MTTTAMDARQLAALSTVANLIAAGNGSGRDEHGPTRADLAAATGMSRASVSQRVDQLIRIGLVAERESEAIGRGRPALTLCVNPDVGTVCAVDLGATHVRLALADLGGVVLAETREELDIADGPEIVLGRVEATLGKLTELAGRSSEDLRAIGIGVPGPVDFATGTVVRPPIMPGWDGYRVPTFFAGRRDVPVLVDNDVNLMALGESARRPESPHLLFVKVGTGIGCGIVSEGALHRGASGAAGDIGHIRVPGADDVQCHCGSTGCVEAVASGAALASILRASDLDVESSQDVVRLVREGNPLARRHIRRAGAQIGEVLAAAVSFHNPDAIVLGGSLAALHEDLLAEIRAVVYRRALPLATRALTIEASRLGERAGVEGACELARRTLLTPDGLSGLLRMIPIQPHRGARIAEGEASAT
jgi:predicted NBD/HSP70 family sugar kinase